MKQAILFYVKRAIHVFNFMITIAMLAFFLLLLFIRKCLTSKWCVRPTYELPLTERSSESILILRTKYGNSSGTIVSNEFFHMEDTISASPIDSFFTFFVDIGNNYFKLIKIAYLCHQRAVSIIIANSVSLCEPDNVHGVYMSGLKIISYIIRTKISFVLWDTCTRIYTQRLLSIKMCPPSSYFRYYSVDNPLYFPDIHFIGSTVENAHMAVRGLFPVYNKDRLLPLEKSIDISFIGQVDGHRSGRLDYISKLIELREKSSFNMCILTNIRNEFLPWDDYFKIIRKSRIVFNFSQSVHSHQFKGRVIEALFANCLLLEHVKSPISLYLTPGLHYSTYNSPEDLIEKIYYFTENVSTAEKIASNGRDFALQHFTPLRFWNAVLHR